MHSGLRAHAVARAPGLDASKRVMQNALADASYAALRVHKVYEPRTPGGVLPGHTHKCCTAKLDIQESAAVHTAAVRLLL
jgi:hypothetical protein